MKFIVLIALLSSTLYGYSQNYYEHAASVEGGGIVFNVDYSEHCFMLSNATNKYDNDPRWYYIDGRELETLDEYDVVYAKKNAGEPQAIRKAFGDELISSLRQYNECPLEIFYVIGPDGTTLEVAFIMDPIPELVSLRPEVFADLERNLKKYVKCEVNEYGRKLKYFHGTSFVNFNRVRLSSELLPMNPIDSLPVIDIIQ